jgi:hypothetical protein
MRFVLAILLTAAFCFIAGLFLPWWSIAIVAFLVGLLFPQRMGMSFISGFTGVFVLWLLLCTWIDLKNEGILSHKIALLFPLGGSSLSLILLTALIGAIVGGCAALSGSSLRGLVLPMKTEPVKDTR